MNQNEIGVMMRALAPVISGFVEQRTAPIVQRLAALEARPVPVNGKDGVGVAGARLSESGCLILNLTDERALEVGLVVGQSGKDAEPVDLKQLAADAAALIPVPANGKDGAPGVDGKNGVDGKDGADGRHGADGRDCKDADPVEVERLVVVEVKKQVEALPKPVDVTGATIDREGTLILVLSNGTTKEVGRVVGRDADVADMKRIIKEEIDKWPRPKDGRDGVDGLSPDDFSVELDGDRCFIFKLSRGEVVKVNNILVPFVLDRGVWREGKYAKGDGVTLGGSFFIAQCETEARPETSPDWRLSVKRGRDGKDGKAGPKGDPGQAGKAGRDLTQVLTDGTKY